MAHLLGHVNDDGSEQNRGGIVGQEIGQNHHNKKHCREHDRRRTGDQPLALAEHEPAIDVLLDQRVHQGPPGGAGDETGGRGEAHLFKEIEDIKQALDVLNRKIMFVATLEANRRDSITLLDAMTELIMVDRMWFTLLRTKESFVDVTGIALDNRTVADFMTRLQQSPYYDNVILKTITQEEIEAEEISLKNFNVSFTKAPFIQPVMKKAK